MKLILKNNKLIYGILAVIVLAIFGIGLFFLYERQITPSPTPMSAPVPAPIPAPVSAPVLTPTITSISPNFGKLDHMIMISGKNFVDTMPNGIGIQFIRDGERVVNIGKASITILSESSLRLQLSSRLIDYVMERIGPGTHQIRVINDHGRSNPLSFTIITSAVPTPPAATPPIVPIPPAATPTITSISPSSGRINDWITIEGRNLVATHFGIGIKFLRDGRETFVIDEIPITRSPDGLFLKFQLTEPLVREMRGSGIYQISILNDNGISNPFNFTIIAQ